MSIPGLMISATWAELKGIFGSYMRWNAFLTGFGGICFPHILQKKFQKRSCDGGKLQCFLKIAKVIYSLVILLARSAGNIPYLEQI